MTWLLLAVLRGRLHPVGGLGVALGVTVLLFPVVQPWYLLWAVIPLAAWATRPGFRTTAIVGHARGRHLRPDRQRRPVHAVPDPATRPLASTVIVALLIALTYNRLPWRKLPDAGEPRGAEPEPRRRAVATAAAASEARRLR